jgi:hypothetical protein
MGLPQMNEHFSYLGGFHANQEPLVLSAKAPWYKQISLTGWISTFAVLGMFFGLSTGLYSCSQKAEVKEVLSYELPIGHTFEMTQAPQKSLKPKSKK